MKSKDYFGLGSGENALYKTLDNGRTWEVVTQGGFNLFDGKTRVIFGSTENKGLTYSDDGGETRKDSNINTGNWGLIIYDTERRLVYACSLDNEGVLISYNDGETWEKTNINFGNYNSVWNNGRVTYGSNKGGVYFIENVGYPYDLGNVVTSNGSFSTETITAEIVPIINKIIAPQIFMEVTGQRFKNDVNDLDLLLPENNKFYISGENYYLTNIDWENDVGMKPFEYTFKEDETNFVISDPKDTDTETMKKNIQKVRTFIETKKNQAIQKMSNKITEHNVDTSNLTEVESTKDELLTAIETEKMYENIFKDSVISVMTTIYNRIFGFSNAMIKKLIYSGIYETIIMVAGKANMQLQNIIYTGKTTVTPEDFSISYDFSKGLKIAFNKYLKSMVKNITVLNVNEDKDLIEVAADCYRKNKPNYLQKANEIFADISLGEIKHNSEDIEILLKYMYEKTLENFHKTLVIEFKHPENLENYSLKDRESIMKYSKAINDKFVERCYEYTNYIYNNVLDLELIKKQAEKILNDIPNRVLALKSIEAFFLKLFKSAWNLNKEII